MKFSTEVKKETAERRIVENLREALREAGICIEIFLVPARRSAVELKEGRLDGEALRVPAYKEIVGDAATMIDEPLASAAGMLISYDPALNSIESLADRSIAAARGVKWTADLLHGHVKINILITPEYGSQVKMLQLKRVDAILLTDITAESYKKELAGTHQTKLVDLSGYAWLRTGLKHRADEFAEAIRAYRSNGRSFFEPVPAKKKRDGS